MHEVIYTLIKLPFWHSNSICLMVQGMLEDFVNFSALSVSLPAVMSVSMNPGARTLTLIPAGPSSLAKDLLNPVRIKK